MKIFDKAQCYSSVLLMIIISIITNCLPFSTKNSLFAKSGEPHWPGLVLVLAEFVLGQILKVDINITVIIIET